jgi:hypothetical protein
MGDEDELFDLTKPPNFFDVETTDEKLELLRESILHLVAAMHAMMRGLVELNAHTNEHHDIINDLGRSVGALEALVIGVGGDDETPAT